MINQNQHNKQNIIVVSEVFYQLEILMMMDLLQDVLVKDVYIH